MDYQGAEKSLLQAAQKDPEARRNSRDRVRENVVGIPNEHEHANTNTISSEAIEPQRSIWVFISTQARNNGDCAPGPTLEHAWRET